MPLNYAPGWKVRVMLNDGAFHEGVVSIKCGMAGLGDWFVTLDDGTQVCVRESQMERL